MKLCPACPCVPRRSPVLPSGPSPCRILFLGEAPSRMEDKYSLPFCGPTGEELNNQYFACAGLFRDSVACTNAFLCSKSNYKNPSPEEAYLCSSSYLPSYLSLLRPQIIVPLGAIPCSLFTPKINLTLQHGIPFPGSLFNWSGIVYPCYHPASGLHQTAYMIPLRRDFTRLGEILKELEAGTFEYPSDPYPFTDYSVIHSSLDLHHYLSKDFDITSGFHQLYELATDTESTPSGSPYCLTFSTAPGEGRLIYASRPDLLYDYRSLLQSLNPLFLLHNYLHDSPVYSYLSLPIPPTRFLDTMVRAYELGLGGGGDNDDEGGGGAARGLLSLKALSLRHLHMRMPSFSDTVLPYTLPRLLSYLTRVIQISQPSPSKISPAEILPVCRCGCMQSVHKTGKTTKNRIGECEGCKECWQFMKAPKPKISNTYSLLGRKAKGLVKKLEAGEEGTDAWKTMKGWPEWEVEFMVNELGEPPVLDIRDVPEEGLVEYACRDADATYRLNTFLNRYKA